MIYWRAGAIRCGMNESFYKSAVAQKECLAQKRHRLIARQRIVDAVRKYFQQSDFIEVSTPTRIQSPAPELHIDAEPSGDHFLIASPELQMKQLVAAGYNKIFQIGKCFRQGETGQHHLPEFTMLEWYETGSTLETLKMRCQGLIMASAQTINQYPTINFGDLSISLDTPWHHVEVQDAFVQHADWRPGGAPDPYRFDLDMVEKVEPGLPTDAPVFLVGYPTTMASLAKIDPENPERALRLELYAGGLELANGFEELTDAAEQRRRFVSEEAERRKQNKAPYGLDNDFLQALELGLPPCAGMAMGLDRLVMLLTDAKKITDVVTFP